MNTPGMSASIGWRQVLSLLGLHVAIIISWMAYHKFQPELLKTFGFTQFALALAIAQGVILTLTPPLAGLAADRARRSGNAKLPVISLGINFVSMVFMVVAATIFIEPQGWIKWLFPVMVVFWLIAMNIFHSPAISLVEQFVPLAQMPAVIAIFAFVADLLQAVEPILNDIISLVGAPLTFTAGGLLVFATGWLFIRIMRQQKGSEADTQKEAPESGNWITLFILGAGTGLSVSLLFNVFPNWAMYRIPWVMDHSLSGNAFISILVAAGAVLTLLAGKLIEKMNLMMLFSVATVLSIALCAGVFYTTGNTSVIMMAAYCIPFALVSVTGLPLAFRLVPKHQLVFGIGIYFSGLQLIDSVIAILSMDPLPA